jgi:hypothetical protein
MVGTIWSTVVLFLLMAHLRSIGCVINNTANVVTAGEIIDSKATLQVATIFNMAQNVLSGVAAFIKALWATFNVSNFANL